MDEDSTSWIRRTNFSHTVYHKIDSSRLASVPIRFRTQEIPNFEPGLHQKSDPETPQAVRTPKQRAVSPLQSSLLSDTFREARSQTKRFSTPHQRRREPDKRDGQYCSSTASPDSRASSVISTANTSPLRNVSPLRSFEKSKMKKDFSWSKLFDHAGGKLAVVEAVHEQVIDLSQLEIGSYFAHGANTRLYHAEYKGEAAAMKFMCVQNNIKSGLLATRLERQYNQEVTFLSRLHHPNVIKFLAACKKPPVYFIVTEYLSEGSLRAYLHKLEHTTLPLQKLVSFALEIARGMEYVHSQGIIHRDLKPENVLLDQDFHLKIADFGTACEESHFDPLADDPGTYRWMAPEMIKRKRYGRKVDVYSFGLILWEMVSGSIPYEDMPAVAVAFAVVYKNVRPSFCKDCPAAMKALIEQCWSLQPEKRPEFWQIVKVLEEFESSLAHDGTLKLVQNSICMEQKKGFLHWIHKLGTPHSHSHSNPTPKPKFS